MFKACLYDCNGNLVHTVKAENKERTMGAADYRWAINTRVTHGSLFNPDGREVAHKSARNWQEVSANAWQELEA